MEAMESVKRGTFDDNSKPFNAAEKGNQASNNLLNLSTVGFGAPHIPPGIYWRPGIYCKTNRQNMASNGDQHLLETWRLLEVIRYISIYLVAKCHVVEEF